MDYSEKAYKCLITGNYSQAVNLWEQAVELEPNVKTHYWYLGLGLLLQGQEVEAQTAWLMGMSDGKSEEVEQWTEELIQVLQTEAQRQEKLPDYTVAWAIRQHLWEINPSDINNILCLMYLGINLDRLSDEDLNNWNAIELLSSQLPDRVNRQLLWQVLKSLLDFAPVHPLSLEFTKACLPYVQELETFLNIIVPASIKVAHTTKQPAAAASLLELGLQLNPEDTSILLYISGFYQNASMYIKGIETARLCYSLVKTLTGKIRANYMLLRALMSASGYWEEFCSVLEEQESLLSTLIAEAPTPLEQVKVVLLLNAPYFRPYFQDNPQKNREIQNKLMQFCYDRIQENLCETVQRYRQRETSKRTKLQKIGYLSNCLCRHSVGWLARGLFQHHNRDRFEIYGYFVNYKQITDSIQNWYVQNVSHAYKGGIYGLEIAEKIYEDEIDILIDLDSITMDISCEILALKPAPIQATWLGWDASGLPSIDYFIADPYVLPKFAQEYYTEGIWRLPQTYIAVDGFEVGIPTLRRDSLDIPNDAIIYLSAQKGYKRHPDTARLQMKIIKAVPSSYFLIKGAAEGEAVKSFFTEIAEEEGVDATRLRFLDLDPSEAVHRANLAIADVVLDTYPYNGATTTLETLWMGIPLVTRVGEQFAARNSYTMMINAGIIEGIAWTDQEYIEWGIRLGEDKALRQQVVWKLRQSRQTAPLWNAQQFAREMESAYEQMWAKYIQS